MGPRELFNSFTLGEMREWARRADMEQARAKPLRWIFEFRRAILEQFGLEFSVCRVVGLRKTWRDQGSDFRSAVVGFAALTAPRRG